MKIDHPEAAQQNRLLRSLQPADFALLAPCLVAVSLGQGQVLCEPGDIVEYVYFPHTAVISFLAVMRHGQTVETATIGRNGLVGGVAGLGRWRAFARMVVQVPGTASRISSTRFRAAFRQSDRLATLVLQCAQAIVVQIQQTAACNALHGVEQRLCRWLLLTQDLANTNVLPLTQDFLSQMLGVRRTTVTQVANKLQTLGMIRTQRGQIEIVDRKALEQVVCECYEDLRSRHAQYVI
ncbi:MAG TPA: Crp/Fnr family transcriptional regulator [Pseudolabrys sp.]|jgi:CRP-like cAMP-binding protein